MPQRPNNSNPFLATPVVKSKDDAPKREEWMPPAENPTNVEWKVVGGKLVLTIDPQYAVGVSNTGKSDLIASTYVAGGLKVGAATVSLTVSIPRGSGPIPADYVPPAKPSKEAK